MSIEFLNGPASEQPLEAGFFAGYRSPRGLKIDESKRDQVETFLEEAFAGRKSGSEIREAFSTSDFTMAAYAAIDTQLMNLYQDLPSVWRQYTDVVTVSDFRPKRLLDKWNATIGLKLVPELTEYPAAGGTSFATFFINVTKYGLRDAISFEAVLNNEAIDELQDVPTKLARAAGETETINALSNLLVVDPATNLASDLNTQFFKKYTSGDFSGIDTSPANLPLTAENLDQVLTQMSTRKNPKSGRQMPMPELQVVIPRAQEYTMKRIQALREIRVTNGTTTDIYDNYLSSISYVVDPMLDSINTNAKASTTWFVLPKTGQARPALFAAFLRGYETPDLRVFSNTGQRVGGGSIAASEGSFEIDDIQHRIRHIVGHQTGDPTFTFASYGA